MLKDMERGYMLMLKALTKALGIKTKWSVREFFISLIRINMKGSFCKA